MTNSLDLFVIGAGSGGIRAARVAAQAGAKVAIAEPNALGGTCVNRGCIPKKLYAMAAAYADDFADAAGYGWHVGTPSLHWETLRTRILGEVARLNGVYRGLLDGTTLLRGRAQLLDAHTVEVQANDSKAAEGTQTFRADRILVATGARTEVPHVQGRDLALVSDQMFDLAELPERLLVVGGGYIACEFATIFARLGSQVVQIHRGERILRGFDIELADVLTRQMRARGVDLLLGAMVEAIEKTPTGQRVLLTDGRTFDASQVLFATGRRPNSEGFGLEEVGVELAPDGAILVDDDFRTNVPSIYALGDVSSPLQLTPVATAEGMTFVDHAFGAGKRVMSYENVPTAVFSLPNLGSVGLTEAAAREMCAQVDIYRSEFRSLRHTLSGRDEKTFMKLIVDRKTGRVVGAHMVGRDAGEVIQGVAIALKAGATKADFDATIGIHPTVAEEFVTMRTAVH